MNLSTTLLLAVIVLQALFLTVKLDTMATALEGVRFSQAVCAARLDGLMARNKIADDKQDSIERMLQKHSFP